MPFYEKGDVRIRYEEVGSGFPLLVTPGGGLNSCIEKWPTAVINAMDAFKDDFRCITMDQRNAISNTMVQTSNQSAARAIVFDHMPLP